MIAAAAAFDRELLRETQAGQRLARVDDLRLGAGDDVGVLPCTRGYTGQELQEVERRAFSREQRARRAFQIAQQLPRFDQIAVLRFPVDDDGRVQFLEAALEPGSAAENGVLARNDRCLRDDAGGDELCREIAAADIFGECGVYVALDFGCEHGCCILHRSGCVHGLFEALDNESRDFIIRRSRSPSRERNNG